MCKNLWAATGFANVFKNEIYFQNVGISFY